MVRAVSKLDKARIVTAVCAELAKSSTLKRACEVVKDAPVPSHFLTWVRDDPDVASLYIQARHLGFLLTADDIMDISDTPQEGQRRTVTTGPDGATTTTSVFDDMIAHRVLRVNTRKWYLSKVLPRLYGEKVSDEQKLNNESVVEALRAIADRLPV